MKKLWFKHDVRSLSDDKLSALILEYGAEGYAVFYAIIEALYENDGNPIPVLTLKRIAKDLRLDNSKVISIADYAASDECGTLLVKSEKGYESARVIRSINESEEKSKKRKEAIKNRWKNTKSEKIDTNVSKIDTNVCKNDTDKDRDRDRDKDRDILSNTSVLSNINSSAKAAELNACASSSNSKDSDLPFIVLKDGQKSPLSQNYINAKQKAFPKVDVMSELWKLQAKTSEFPSERIDLCKIDGYINRWLQNAVNDAENKKTFTPTAKPKTGRTMMASDEVWKAEAAKWNVLSYHKPKEAQGV